MPVFPLCSPSSPQDLKAALLEHARLLADCKRHGALFEYCLYALGVVDDMPQWDADAHNKVRPRCDVALLRCFGGCAVAACRAAGSARESSRCPVPGALPHTPTR